LGRKKYGRNTHAACDNRHVLRTIKYETITERTCNGKMIAFTQFGQFASARATDKKQDRGTLALCFIYSERSSGALAAGRNRHNELTRSRHRNQARSVKTKENDARRELRPIQYTTFVNRCGRLEEHAVPILGQLSDIRVGVDHHQRNAIFNRICDV
jgi:hypothetical protein